MKIEAMLWAVGSADNFAPMRGEDCQKVLYIHTVLSQRGSYLAIFEPNSEI